MSILPNSVILENDVSICQGDSGTLLDAGSGHTNYLWNTEKLPKPFMQILLGHYDCSVMEHQCTNNSLSFDGQDDYVELPQQILQTR